jgi:hypothetical protein
MWYVEWQRRPRCCETYTTSRWSLGHLGAYHRRPTLLPMHSVRTGSHLAPRSSGPQTNRIMSILINYSLIDFLDMWYHLVVFSLLKQTQHILRGGIFLRPHREKEAGWWVHNDPRLYIHIHLHAKIPNRLSQELRNSWYDCLRHSDTQLKNDWIQRACLATTVYGVVFPPFGHHQRGPDSSESVRVPDRSSACALFLRF